MKKVKLGSSDLQVTEVCLGSMTWGQQNTQSEGHEQIDYALDQGINFIDTAELYSVPPSKKFLVAVYDGFARGRLLLARQLNKQLKTL